MVRVGGGGSFDAPKGLRSVVGDCVGLSVRPAGAGNGIVGRGGSEGVFGTGVSSGGVATGRRTGKGGGAREEMEGDVVEGPAGAETKGRDDLGSAPDGDGGGLVAADLCRGGGRGGREFFGGTRLPSLSLDAMLGSREIGCRVYFAGSLSSVGLGE